MRRDVNARAMNLASRSLGVTVLAKPRLYSVAIVVCRSEYLSLWIFYSDYLTRVLFYLQQLHDILERRRFCTQTVVNAPN